MPPHTSTGTLGKKSGGVRDGRIVDALVGFVTPMLGGMWGRIVSALTMQMVGLDIRRGFLFGVEVRLPAENAALGREARIG